MTLYISAAASEVANGLSCVVGVGSLVYLVVSERRSAAAERAPLLRTDSAVLSDVAAAPSRRIGSAMLSLSLVRLFLAVFQAIHAVFGGAGLLVPTLTPLSWLAAVVIVLREKPFSKDRLFKVIPQYVTILAWLYGLALFADCLAVYQLIASSSSEAPIGSDRSVIDLISIPITSALLLLNTYQRSVLEDHIERQKDEAFTSAGKAVPSREPTASIISTLFFTWVNPLMRLGQRKHLAMEDIPDLMETCKAATAIRDFEQYRGKFKNLAYTLFWSERWGMLYVTFFAILSSILSMNGPFFLYKITGYIKDPQGQPVHVVLLYVICLALFTLIRAVCNGQTWHTARYVAVRLKAVLVNDIYKKSLHRVATTGSAADSKDTKVDDDDDKDKEDLAGASVGKIVTLMSSDAEKVKESLPDLPDIILFPFEILIATTGLFLVVGWPALAGLAVMVGTLPVTFYLAKWQDAVFDRLLSATDKRTTLVNEALQGIRIIKYFSWETKFLEKIDDARKKEMRRLIDFYIQGGFGGFVWMFGPILVSFTTLLTITKVAGMELDAQMAFTCLSLFNAIRIPLAVLPEVFVNIIQLKVSVERIDKFLKQEELEKYTATDAQGAATHDSNIIGFRGGWFQWYSTQTASADTESDNGKADKIASNSQKSDDSKPLLPKFQPSSSSSSSTATLTALADGSSTDGSVFTLRGIDLSLPSGGLTAICGATGSGKSSIVQALLGEMKRLNGLAYFPDPRFARPLENGLMSGVAYVAQQSWLQNATIRDNITFGEPYDPVRYDRVIRACALVKDLETLDAGDLTEIGENGINLSGGQKQRVSLARAAYSRASYILLDDPLSAVDAPTARHLFDKAILGLLRGRTRILVTHATAVVLPSADYVVVVKGGSILAAGTVQSVMKNPESAAVLEFDEAATSPVSPSNVEEEYDVSAIKDYANGKTAVDARKLVEVEGKQSGAVKLSVYLSYVAAAGGFLFIAIFVFVMILERSSLVANDYWIKTWSEAYDAVESNVSVSLLSSVSGSPRHKPLVSNLLPFTIVDTVRRSRYLNALDTKPAKEAVDVTFYITIYALLGLLWLSIYLISFTIRSIGQYNASQKFHRALMNRIFGAPMRFFDTTPIGRILNRASKDIAAIDRNVMGSFDSFMGCMLDASTVIVVVSVVTPVFLFAALPVSIVYVIVAKRYLDASREIKRLESVTRSPIYSMFSETLTGAATIRAYGAEDRFMIENLNRVDTNHRAFYYLWATNRWLGVRISLIAAIIILFSGISTVLARDVIGAGLAGLSLTWALTFSDILVWVIRVQSWMEMSMNAVERVDEYLVIDQERPAVIKDNRPPTGWPTRGAITVENLEMRYAPNQDPVLRDVSFSIKGGQKVGIVGRTGAGKSSLSLSIFRIVEPSQGRIIIDGIDISEIGLHDLRSSLTMIPQDPVLFAGTVRSNLDPFSEHDDAALWNCLDKVRFLDSLQGAASDNEAMSRSLSSASLLDFETPNRPESVVSASSAAANFSLDAVVSEGGSNYSQGQRQLLCLARALLKSSRVTILDEATASVDNETDSRIQDVIRGPEFSDKTVLAIAHRLRTVADYDMILLLDKGQVKEFGTPYELMMREDGQFRNMCVESGEFDELVAMAKK